MEEEGEEVCNANKGATRPTRPRLTAPGYYKYYKNSYRFILHTAHTPNADGGIMSIISIHIPGQAIHTAHTPNADG